MRRKEGSQEGSLDLLLDTICNTFGGVLFISILVVVLLNLAGEQASEEPPDTQTQVKLIEAQLKLENRQETLRKLRATLTQFHFVEDDADTEELRKLLADLRAIEEQRAAAIEKKNQRLNAISKMQIDTNDSLKKIQERKEIEESLASAQRQLSQEKAKRAQNAKPGIAHKTSKEEVVLFLQKGRLCSYGSVDSSGKLVPNPSEWSINQDAKGAFIVPNPRAGVHVNILGNNALAHQKISRFSRSKHYLAIFVWPDSFPEFKPLKEILKKERFEYKLVPMDTDSKVYAGTSTDPSESEVQN